MWMTLWQQHCRRSDTVSLLAISAFQRITLPSKGYEIHSHTVPHHTKYSHSHTTQNLGLPHPINFLNLDISCMWLLRTQKQIFQYHYARILGGQNHSGHDVRQEGTGHASSPVSIWASLLTQLTLFLPGITYQIITHIVILTSTE